MLRRKFGQLLASGLALMGLGRSTAKRRGGQLSILFSHGKFSRECVWADVIEGAIAAGQLASDGKGNVSIPKRDEKPKPSKQGNLF